PWLEACDTHRCRLATKFSDRTPAYQHAGAHDLLEHNARSPAAVHFMCPRFAATPSWASPSTSACLSWTPRIHQLQNCYLQLNLFELLCHIACRRARVALDEYFTVVIDDESPEPDVASHAGSGIGFATCRTRFTKVPNLPQHQDS